jgi:hypothetical protein
MSTDHLGHVADGYAGFGHRVQDGSGRSILQSQPEQLGYIDLVIDTRQPLDDVTDVLVSFVQDASR